MNKGRTGISGKVMAWLVTAAMAFGVPGPCISFAEDVPTQAVQGVQTAAAATAASTDEGLKAQMPQAGNVTVNFKEVDILTVLNYLSEVSGVDIIPSPGVDAKVTMRLRDKPWEQALDIVTRNYGYVFSREGDVIRVIPKSQVGMEEPITEVIVLNNLIREIELSKGATGSSSSASVADVTVKQKEQSIQQLMSAISSILDSKRGEKATYVSGVNSIVVTAIPTKINEIKKMVAKIDRRTPQVVLDTKVVEIVLGDTEKFGVDWNAVIKAAGARRPITFPFTNSGDLNFLPSQQRDYMPQSTDITGALLPGQNGFPYVNLSNMINGTTMTSVTNAANMFSYGTLDFSTFTATLSLLENRADTEILSAPRITTLDNQKATIKVIKKIMLQKTQETTQTAGIVTVEFESEADAREVGVKLIVVPHVNEKGEVSVNLMPEVSTDPVFTQTDVGVAGTATVALQYSSREANTIVRAKDGETIFLGGLIRKNTAKKNNKLPILGDLFGGVPWLGSAFKYDEDVTERTEIAFFVTVHLVKDGMDSIRKTDSMNRYNDYFVNPLPSIAPSKPTKDVRQKPDDKRAVSVPENVPTVVQSEGLINTDKTVKIEVPRSSAVESKKKSKPFWDFSKKK
jgi:type II secretory pathway component GspD/PulD (secretin)